MFRFFLTSFLVCLTFCSSTDKSRYVREDFPYRLDHPDKKIVLPEYLSEISGVAWFSSDTIICLQDEKAIVYFLSAGSASPIGKYEFGKHGDFEDITCNGQIIYALRSDGTIFEIKIASAKRNAIIDKTPLTEKNNTEGLAWDNYTGSLLIACKGSPSTGKNKINDHLKAVYQYDPFSDLFSNDPLITVRLDKSEYFETPALFVEFSMAASKISFKPASFHPSAISVHPVTGNIYLLSATGRIILILNRSGRIVNFSFLDPDMFIQPEGLCFSPAGDLYISNEGRGGYGNILMFNPVKP